MECKYNPSRNYAFSEALHTIEKTLRNYDNSELLLSYLLKNKKVEREELINAKECTEEQLDEFKNARIISCNEDMTTYWITVFGKPYARNPHYYRDICIQD